MEKKWKTTKIKKKAQARTHHQPKKSWQKKSKSRFSSRRIKQAKPGLFKKIIILGIVLFFIGSSLIVATISWLNYTLPSPEKLLERDLAQTTKIYDRTGKVILYEIFAEQRRTMVNLTEIPKNLIQATLVAEDKDFFTHPGFDLKAILRAIIVDIIQGGKVQGGSTLTQQFIKNAFLTTQKTYKRKITEILLAYQIEKKFSKQEILQMYFNEIPYGSNAYGAEAASQIYFSKTVRDITLDEAALLASLPKAPTHYSPHGNYQDELINRRNYILNAMKELGYITRQQQVSAKKINTLEKISPKHANIIAPHFVMYIKDKLTEKYGAKQIEQGGLKIITTIDIAKQTIAEQAIAKYAEINQKKYNASNAALICLDVQTGEILAMVGSKNFFDKEIDGQVNVTISNRQPGSSFKPIVYAAAFSKGYTPETILFDVETNFGPAGPDKIDYIPKNYNEEYFGPVSIRKALAGSLNVPGVKTIYLTGMDSVLTLAQKMGYTTLGDRKRYGLSLVLGGGEVKLLEHVSALAVFANHGKKSSIISILKIEDNNKNILEEKKDANLSNEKIISPNTANLITSILSDNDSRSFVFGEKNSLTLPDRPVAAKTGTTNDFRDAWTIGYTPDIAVGVWVGNSNNEEMADKSDGSNVAAPIWQEFMINALKNTPVKTFKNPKPNQSSKSILRGEIPEQITLKIDKASGKLATELTPAKYIIEKTFKAYYPILYYIDKDNPDGPIPSNPMSDPQYVLWKESIEKWLKEMATKPTEEDIEQTNKEKNPSINEEEKEQTKINLDKVFEMPPIEYDDVHIPANMPKLSILYPTNNALITKQMLEVKLTATATRGIQKIICYVNNTALATIFPINNKTNITCPLNLSGLNLGKHILEVMAIDDVGNNTSTKRQFTTMSNFAKKIDWVNPQTHTSMQLSEFPLTLSILPPAIKIKMVRFYSKNLETAKTNLLGTVFFPESSAQINFDWNITNKGIFEVWAEIIDDESYSITGNKIEIEVK